MALFYLGWKTWAQGKIETPWDFWIIGQDRDDARLKNGYTSSLKKPSKELILSAFQTQNTEILEEINEKFSFAAKLCAFVESDSEEEAKNQVLGLFEDAEFNKISQVDPQTKNQIIYLLNNRFEIYKKPLA